MVLGWALAKVPKIGTFSQQEFVSLTFLDQRWGEIAALHSKKTKLSKKKVFTYDHIEKLSRFLFATGHLKLKYEKLYTHSLFILYIRDEETILREMIISCKPQ